MNKSRVNLKTKLGIGNFVLIIFLSFLCLNEATSQELSSQALTKLGRKLFFDKTLSFNKTKSCSSCHDPKLAFTDGYRKSLGATADLHMRNSPTLINVADNLSFTASDPSINTLEKQIRGPLFNKAPLELGISGHEDEVITRLKLDSQYEKISNWELIIKALAEYVRSIKGCDSSYDNFLKSNELSFLKIPAQRGMKLFFSQSLGCSDCHGGKNFNTPKITTDRFVANGFFSPSETHVNTKYKPDLGLALTTNKPADVGKFRIPTLRNVSVTAPYMHDGSISTLEEVIAIYAKGGISKTNISPRIKGFSITQTESADLVAFLESLTCYDSELSAND